MTISLSPELEKLINDKVQSGKYASASEVIRVSLQLLDEQEKRDAERIAKLKGLLQEGIEAADRGELIDGETVFQELQARNRQRREIPPVKRDKTAKDLLKFAATWQGDDLETCLDIVRETRSETQF